MKTSLKIVVGVLVTMMSSAFVSADSQVLTRIPGVKYTSSALARMTSVNPMTDSAASMPVYYNGGPVISNVKIVAVQWGTGLDPAVVSGMGPFYTALTASTYYSWFTEYDTNITSKEGKPGTDQIIGAGSFVGDYAITPSVTSTTIDDTQIQSELASQISSGKLPKPDANTVYMVNFPQGSAVTMQGATSCQDFCAYHNSFTSGGSTVIYGVLPDSSAPGCIQGCGPATTDFQVITTDASHEVGEAITDPDVGNSSEYAWQLSDGSEIGDPSQCVTDVANITAADGTAFQVQGLWSNKRQACVFGP